MSLSVLENAVTMDSREIARLTSKRHADVMRDIETQLEKLAGGVRIFAYTYRHEQNGQKYRCFKLPYRETMILVSGYSVELRAKVIDRWMELENKNIVPFEIPKTFVEALRLAADQAEKLEVAKKQIEFDRPKVKFYDAVTGSKDTIDIGDAAKVLAIPGFGRNNLFYLLRRQKILMENNVPYQRYVDCGYFRIIESSYTRSDGSSHVNLKTVVYQRGLEMIRRIIKKEQISD